jgi:DNA polymerase I-like protein with 3'-5' exonuclease and polymerase domains
MKLDNLPQTLIVADYSSLEVGVQGDFCVRLFGDDQLVKAYAAQTCYPKENRVDIHSNNARSVFGVWLGWTVPETITVKDKLGSNQEVRPKYAGQRVDKIPVTEFKEHPFGEILRDIVKAVWYGLAYGKGAYGFSTLVGADGKMLGEDRAQEMIDALLSAVPGMRNWFAWVDDYVKENHGIYSLGGRWCDLSLEMETGDEWKAKRAFRRAYNFPMQATGAEIIGDAMVRVMRDKVLRNLGFRTCLQVHDELVLRGPLVNVEEAKLRFGGHMRAATANGVTLMFQPEISIGHAPTYGEAK